MIDAGGRRGAGNAAGAARSAPAAFVSPIADFYLTNPIARASKVMAECSALAKGRRSSKRRNEDMTMDLLLTLLIIVAKSLGDPGRRCLVLVAYYILADRKIWAAVQLRQGPERGGTLGHLAKFRRHDQVPGQGADHSRRRQQGRVPDRALITATLALAAWAVIPVNNGWAVANINVGVLYIFAISSLGVYGIIMGGWASNSKYPFLSALRSAAQMVSYEVSIGFVIITVLLCAGSLNLNDVVTAQDTKFGMFGWYWLPLFPMFVIFFISALAETNRPPFDLVGSGIGTGRRLHGGIFGLAIPAVHARRICRHHHHVRAADRAVLRRLAAARNIVPFTWVPGVVWFVLKVSWFFFLFAMVKAFVPRYRYDQLMRLGWKVFLPISLVAVVVVAGVLEFAGKVGSALEDAPCHRSPPPRRCS